MNVILFIFINLNGFSAEYPMTRVSGKLTFADKNKICIGAPKNETCFERKKKYEYITSENNDEFDLIINNNEIIWDSKHD